MDPDANLEQQLKDAEEILALDMSGDDDGDTAVTDLMIRNKARRLAEHVQALHEWVSKGGFLPKKWKGYTVSTKQRGKCPKCRNDIRKSPDGSEYCSGYPVTCDWEASK